MTLASEPRPYSSYRLDGSFDPEQLLLYRVYIGQINNTDVIIVAFAI